jgi:hypothetical protein
MQPFYVPVEVVIQLTMLLSCLLSPGIPLMFVM